MEHEEPIRSIQALVRENQALHEYIDNIPTSILVYHKKDSVVRVVKVNAYLSKIMGPVAEELLSQSQETLISLIHPEDRAAAVAFFTEVLEHGRPAELSYRTAMSTKSAYRWYHASAMPVRQADGSVLGYTVFADITDEKKEELEAIKAKRMYQLLAEESKLIVMEYNRKTHEVYYQMDNAYTRAICEAQGMPAVVGNVPESLVGMVDEPYRDTFRSMFEQGKDGLAPVSCEYSSTIQGQTHWWRVNVIPVWDKDGAYLTTYCAAQDITELRQEQEQYLEFFRNLDKAYPSNLGSFHLNLTKNICLEGKSPLSFVLRQKQAGTVDGYLDEFSKLIADKNTLAWFRREITREKLLERFSAGESSVSFEYTIEYPDGIHWRQAIVVMHQNPKTGDVEAVTYAINIDEQKRNDLIIKQMLREGFDYIGVIYLKSGMFEFFNKNPKIKFPDVHEITSYETCRSYVCENFVDPAEREQYMEMTELDNISAALVKYGRHIASYSRTEQGSHLRYELIYNWLDRENGEILVIRSDVTAAYRQEQRRLREVQEALKQAEAANRAKTEFVSRISHDIRTPISAITSMTAFAKEDIGDEKKLRDDLQKLEASNTFLLSLVSDILDISKIDSGKMELHPEPYPYDEYSECIRSMFEPLCQQKGIRFQMSGGAAKGHSVIVDRVRFNQIALNLLSNAVKYTPAGGSITYTSESSIRPDGQMACTYTIRDTGIGMSEEFQKKMFEPFTQETGNARRESTAGGSGLGLSIVKRIVDLMGGFITVESELGRGTAIAVHLVLPQASDEALGRGKSAGKPPDSGITLHGKALLAEDNLINTEIAIRILEKFGLEIAHAADGGAAVSMFRDSAPGEYRAIFMDLQMPVLNGYDAAKQIRALPRPDAKTVPIIAMTADAFAAAMELSREAGMDDYVTKPLDPVRLKSVLSAYLTDRK